MSFGTLDKAIDMEQQGIAEKASNAFTTVKEDRLDKKVAFKSAKSTVLEKKVARDKAKEALQNLHFPHIIKIMKARKKFKLAKKDLEIAKRKETQAKLEYKQSRRKYKNVRKIIRNQYKNVKSYDKFDKIIQKMQSKGLDLSKNEYIMNQFRQAVKNSKGKKLVFDENAIMHSGIPGVPPEVFKDIKNIWHEHKSSQEHSQNRDLKTFDDRTEPDFTK